MEKLLKKLENANIHITLKDNDLEVHFDEDTIPQDLITELKAQKAALVRYLKERTGDFDSLTILPQDQPAHIPLSFNQERLWFIDKLHGTTNYHLASVIKLEGHLEMDILERVFNRIVDRHQILRTIYLEEKGIPYQKVMPEGVWKFDYVESIAIENKEAIKNKVDTTITKPFDLATDYMLRIGVLQLEETVFQLIIVMHHIASDGWSVPIFIDEFSKGYTQAVQNRNLSHDHLPIQFSDYAIWEKTYYQKSILEDKLAYWKQKLEGYTNTELRTDYPRPHIQSTKGNSISFTLNLALVQQLKNTAKQHGTTTNVLLLTIFKILLYKYTGQEDICIGTPVANRAYKNTEGLIGYFVNTLALRTQLHEKMLFSEAIQNVKDTILSGFENQDVPFEKIVKEVVSSRDLSRNPIFQIMFAFQNYKQEISVNLPNLSITSEALDRKATKFDLSCNVIENDENLHIELEYCTDLYAKETIAQIFAHYQELIHQIVHTSDQKITDYTFVSKAELRKIEGFNATSVMYSAIKNIVVQFVDWANKNGDKNAIIFEGKHLTYKELDDYSTKIAQYLIQATKGKPSRIGICLDRSFEMVIGLLGILKSGAAYIPIDTEYPTIRKEFIVNDASIAILLTNENALENTQGLPCETVTIETVLKSAVDNSIDLPQIALTDLAYIIYTSGTTGNPKGVMNTHEGLLNRLEWAQDYFQLNPSEDKVLQKTTFCFDVSVWEFFWPLAKGIPLVLCNPDGHKDNVYLQQLILKEKITTLHFVPSMLETFLMDWDEKNTTSLQRVLCSGEALQSHQINLFQSKFDVNSIALFNLYGPTEAAIDVTCWTVPLHDFQENSKVVIGKPVSNTTIHIIDENGNPSGIGVIGELVIAGVQVAKGYLNRPELTQKHFGKIQQGNVETSTYKTGDLARWLPNGTIEYIGRNDSQVKIRGNRIELGEIKNRLLEIDTVKQAEVLVKEYNNTDVLVAYIVTSKNRILHKQEVRKELQALLPDYMIPHFFIEIPKVPITSNGKLDKKALPEINADAMIHQVFKEASTTEEKMLVTIWKQVLATDTIGIDDNFFELGGDSIMVIQVVSKVKQHGYHIHPRDVFTNQTIASLSTVLHKTDTNTSAEQGVLTGDVPLLPIQKEFFQKDPPNPSHFNQSILLKVAKEITPDDLKAVIDELYQQHDALRMRFTYEDAVWKQEYGKPSGILEYANLEATTGADFEKTLETTCDAFQRSLEIKEGKVSVFALIKTPEFEEKNRLLIVLHHLVTDGVSWRILLSTLMQLIENRQKGIKYSMPTKSNSYREWGNYLKDYTTELITPHESVFWENIIKKDQKLPVDNNIKNSTRNSLAFEKASLSQEFTDSLLKDCHAAFHTEINDILLSALALTLHEWTGYDTHVIGLEGHGRITDTIAMDLSDTVGWFTTLFPVALGYENDLGSLIKATKEHLKSIPNKGLGYGCLRYTNDSNVAEQEPLQIIFNYLGRTDTLFETSNEQVEISNEAIGTLISEDFPISYAMEFNGFLEGNTVTFICNYNADEYHKNTIQRIMSSFVNHLQELITYCIHKEKKEKTPSDFGLQSWITYKEWDEYLIKKKSWNIANAMKLSPLQEGLLFHSIYEKKQAAYFQQLTIDFSSELNIDHFKKSWEYLVRQHSILRSAIAYQAFKTPLMFVLDAITLPLTITSIEDVSAIEETIQKHIDQDREQGIDITNAPLFRIHLFIHANGCKMLMSLHHLIMDGWSLSILMQEFIEAYTLLSQNQPLVSRSKDFYGNFINFLENRNIASDIDFWKTYVKGIESPTKLPFLKNIAEKPITFKEEKLQIPKIEADTVFDFARQSHITVNTLIQAVWGILLSKYTNTDEVLFGVTVSGRPPELEGIENSVGLYINTIPLRLKINRKDRVNEWLQKIQLAHAATRMHQYTPLHEIQSFTDIKGDIFDSLLVFENYPVDNVLKEENPLLVSNIHLKEETNYPLTLVVLANEEIEVRFKYNTSITSSYIQDIKGQFELLLAQLVSNEHTLLGELEYLPSSHRLALVPDTTLESATYPTSKTLLDCFENQVISDPKAIALVYEGTALSYEALDAQANQLGAYLQDVYGIGANDFVGIQLERSEQMIISILGILKAGGAYVPIDPNYPDERKNYIIEDSGCKVILDEAFLSSFSEVSARYRISKPKRVTSSEDIAYIIYTSGTTGNPKGVLITHENVIQLYFNEGFLFDFGSTDVWTLFHSYSFDFSVWEIFGALLFGGKLVIVPLSVAKDPERFSELLETNAVTVLNQTPSGFSNLIKSGTIYERSLSLRYVIFGGEALSVSQLVSWHSVFPAVSLINMYGITEITIHATFKKLTLSDIDLGISNIGKPLPGMRIYILDAHQQLLPKGAIGEMYVSGSGVSQGYLNQPALTGEKFISDPFVKGAMMYKTGDLARWLSTGELEFMGRKDFQVKIRGHRIELGAIESKLIQYTSSITQVVVTTEEVQGIVSLVAYYETTEELSKSALRTYLQGRLPDYMVPGYYIRLSAFPQTTNGKVAMKLLPKVASSDLIKQTYVAPANEMEEQLVAIWEDVLDVERIGMTDNFFDLGGDSIKSVRLLGAINKAFHSDVEIATLFKNPILKDFITHADFEKETVKLQEEQRILQSFEKEKQLFYSENSDLVERIEDMYPASEIQKGMLFHYKISKGVYHDQMVHFNFYSDSIFENFTKAVQLLVNTHEILRTSFSFWKGKQYQLVHKELIVDHKIIRYDLTEYTTEEQQYYIKAKLQEDKENLFDEEAAGLFRFILFKLTHETYCICFVCHHAIIDGWSDASFNVELHNTLLQLHDSPEYIPSTLKNSYKHYVLKETLSLENKELLHFWQTELSECEPIKFPTYTETNKRNVFKKALLPEMVENVQKISSIKGIPLKNIHVAAFVYALGVFNYHKDIVFGIISNNRPPVEDGDKILGCFLNTIPFRMKIPKGETIHLFIQKVHDKLSTLNEYSTYPYSKIKEKIIGNTEASIDDVLFTYTDFHIYSELHGVNPRIEDSEIQQHAISSEVTNNSAFSLVIDGVGDNYNFILSYNTDFIDESSVNLFYEIYSRFLTELTNDKTLDKLEYLPNSHRLALVPDTTLESATYPTSKTLLDYFETQVISDPKAIALVYEGTALSYEALDAQANQLGAYLQDVYGIGANDFVGIQLERSEQMIISILGILKADGAYVPIDPNYPDERKNYIIEDSGCKVILDEAFLSSFSEVSARYSASKTKRTTSSEDIAYIIYTSGTTGNPKGVLITHENVIQLYFNEGFLFDFGSTDVWTLFHSYSFDFSVWEIFGALLFGGKLVIVPLSVAKDPERFSELLETNAVTVLNQTPSGFSNLIKSGTIYDKSLSLRYVIFGGEALSVSQLASWHSAFPAVSLINMYGITEITIHATFKKLTLSDIDLGVSNIGKPLPGMRIYILDAHQQLLPKGAIGEMYVSGSGVSQGYLNQPALTGEKFISDPFMEGAMMYKTGDLARWLSTGELEFMGRKDFQVKIRGHRIELGAIESKLIQYTSSITQVVVTTEEVQGIMSLVAYYETTEELSKSALRTYLQGRLPDYMVPGYYIRLSAFPQTTNGKVAMKLLPKVASSDLIKQTYVAPANEMEEQLVAIWEDVLDVERIGMTDNFFDLGGHSLLMAQIINIVYKELQGTISYAEFMENPNIRSLGKHLKSKTYLVIPKAAIRENYPLTASQHRMWVLSQFEGGNISYNIFGTIQLEGRLDIEKFKTSFNIVIQKHEILRTYFKANDVGEVFQYIVKNTDVNFEIPLLDFQEKTESSVHAFIQKMQSIPFDLEQASLLKAWLLKTNENVHIFSFVMHHIIGDGWSVSLFVKEIIHTYNLLVKGENIAYTSLPIQYKDYALWLQTEAVQSSLKRSQKYWISKFQGEIPILNLPSFKKRPSIQTFNGATITKQFSKGFLDTLQQFSKTNEVTLFMTLMAGINALMHRYTEQEDIVLGTPIAGRNHPDLENQIGVYLNTLPIRTTVKKTDSFQTILAHQKQVLVEAYEHQEYPFDELIGQLKLKRDTSRSALFDVMVVLQSQSEVTSINSKDSLEGIKVTPYEIPYKTAQFDMTFTFVAHEELELSINYNTDIYDVFLATQIFTHLEAFLSNAMLLPEEKVSAIPFLTDSEREKLSTTCKSKTIEVTSKDQNIIDLFKQQVTRFPDKDAVVFKTKTLSYLDLEKQSNRFADYLIKNYRITTNDLVELKLPKNEQLLIAIFGILKSGAAYVPVDIQYPEARISYIENDAKCKVVVDEALWEQFLSESVAYSDTHINQSTSKGLAYIIYTSGTTGNPKGVMITHQNLNNLFNNAAKKLFDFTHEDVWCLFHSHCFDFSVWEIFGALVSGGKLVILPETQRIDHENLIQIFIKEGVTVFNQTPTSFHALQPYLIERAEALKIRYLIFGGEKLENTLLQTWKQYFPTCRTINMYGITETTVHNTFKELTAKDVIVSGSTIGEPIPGIDIQLLNTNLQLVPYGVVGEMYVSGAGLAKAYLNRPEITKSRFFDITIHNKTKRYYRTGDLARRLPNGELQYMGRIDDQIKIKGHRIEPGELEFHIQQYSEKIKQVVVVVKEINQEKALVAYYATTNEELSKAALRSYLQKQVPGYMIPAYFVTVDTIPLTPNGKIDKAALPVLMQEDVIKKQYKAPENDTEKQLAAIWENVLEVQNIGVMDDFFELGGHSLKIIKVISLIQKQFNIKIEIEEFFMNPTISYIAQLIDTVDLLSSFQSNPNSEEEDELIF